MANRSQKNRPVDQGAEEEALARSEAAPGGEHFPRWLPHNEVKSWSSSFAWLKGSAKLNRFSEPIQQSGQFGSPRPPFSPAEYEGEVLCSRSSLNPILPWTPYVDENGMAYVRVEEEGSPAEHVAIPANSFLIVYHLPNEGQ